MTERGYISEVGSALKLECYFRFRKEILLNRVKESDRKIAKLTKAIEKNRRVMEEIDKQLDKKEE